MHYPVLEALELRTAHAFLNNDAVLSGKFDVGTGRHVGATLERWWELMRAMAVLHLERGGQPLR